MDNFEAVGEVVPNAKLMQAALNGVSKPWGRVCGGFGG